MTTSQDELVAKIAMAAIALIILGVLAVAMMSTASMQMSYCQTMCAPKGVKLYSLQNRYMSGELPACECNQ